YVKRWLQLGWRRWLTERVLKRWMAHGLHYGLVLTPGEHDNPDGRIAEDIHIATETAIALAHTLVYSLLILGSFIDILWSVSGSIGLPGTAVNVPGYMVLLAFAYAAIGTLLGWLVGKPLIASTNRLQTAEADFRFGLARARENSEAIALMHGEGVERKLAGRLFDAVASSWNLQTWAYTGIVSFSNGYGTLLPVFPLLVAAPQYIAGTMTLGVLMQAAQAFQRLTSALSWPIDNLGDMAKCRASADRVWTLYADLIRLEAQVMHPEAHRIAIGKSTKPLLSMRDLCIANPDGQILLENFNAEFHRGERVLIAGDPAVTINLFKAVAGLWPWGSGEILLPEKQAIAFVPQRPFLPHGTLRAVLTYPAQEDNYNARAIHFALECAGIAWLAPRLHEIDTWDRILPLRAQQRLGFARLFLQQPCWIFIEEATDALDPDGEADIMHRLQRELPNAALITIGFHAGLAAYHQRKLVLNRLTEEKFLFRVTDAVAPSVGSA
ncbi:MAG TPA: SbmA/BacA-like family transporter, partial [Spongiibacteraceae bacterium]|nr:SbmA/BacA-like family transporter [Spongiibacteraceae bacterium]